MLSTNIDIGNKGNLYNLTMICPRRNIYIYIRLLRIINKTTILQIHNYFYRFIRLYTPT